MRMKRNYAGFFFYFLAIDVRLRKHNLQDLLDFVSVASRRKKKRGRLSVSLGVGGGARTHDLQIHNLAL